MLELRTANWVARREEAGPKTIEQIHKVRNPEDGDDYHTLLRSNGFDERMHHTAMSSKQFTGCRHGCYEKVLGSCGYWSSSQVKHIEYRNDQI